MKDKGIVILLILVVTFCSLCPVFGQGVESGIAPLFERQRLLFEVMQEKRPSPVLLVVLEVPGEDLKRLEEKMQEFSKGSSNYRYLERKRDRLVEEAAADRAFNQKMIEAFRQLRYFDDHVFVADTVLKRIAEDSICLSCRGSEGQPLAKDFLEGKEFIFLHESIHPVTQTRGYYFYNAERLYLDNPFPDYIAYRNVLDKLLQVIKPGEEVRRPPEYLVKTINEKF
ncbi:MAG TPA: hypothetical protein VJ917_09195, partial [Saprospiraceae bacterium]|nr:hypothetical protein [Saprospiraceae bacterium]